MLNHNKATTSLAVIGLFIVASPVFSAELTPGAIADEVNACVAEVREHADYSDAIRVRHDVVAVERRTVGYSLAIDTLVFGKSDDVAIRQYAATCIVNGNYKPMSFKIEQVG